MKDVAPKIIFFVVVVIAIWVMIDTQYTVHSEKGKLEKDVERLNKKLDKLEEDNEEMNNNIEEKEKKIKKQNNKIDKKSDEIDKLEDEVALKKQQKAEQQKEKKKKDEKKKDAEDDSSKNKTEESVETVDAESGGEKQSVEITFYTAHCNTCPGTGKTASGHDVNNTIYHNGKRIVAAPSHIPLNTDVIVHMENGDSFKAVVLDRGGDITSGRLDVLVESDAEARELGRQQGSIEILN